MYLENKSLYSIIKVVLDENNQSGINYVNMRENKDNDSDSCISIDSKSKLEFLDCRDGLIAIINIFLFLDSESHFEQKKSEKTTKLDNLFMKFRVNKKAKEFLEAFKDKMKAHLKVKKEQDIKSFLNNLENYLSQHINKSFKRAKIKLVEDNYDQFVVFVINEMLKGEIVTCQYLEYALKQHFSTTEQIRASLMVKKYSEASKTDQEDAKGNTKEEYQEEAHLHTENHARIIKKMLEKVVQKLSNKDQSSKPKKLVKLQKDIQNQIKNAETKGKTTEIEKAIIIEDAEMTNRIISVLEDLRLIYIKRAMQGYPITYAESILEQFKNSKAHQNFNTIIQNRCK